MTELLFFFGKKYFDNYGLQYCLALQSVYNTSTMTTDDTETIIVWKVKGLSHESIKPSTPPGNSLAPKMKWIYDSKKQ